MTKVEVKIEGIPPGLLQHRYVFADEREESAKKRSGKKDYSDEWKAALYWDDKVGIIQPANHLEAAMIKAATSFLIPGKGKKTYKDLFKCAVFVSPEYIPHGINGDKDALVKKKKIYLDKRLVRVNNSGIERVRPLLKAWKLKFEIEIHDDQIAVDTVHQVLSHAGRFVGIGDFRPRYGRFMITSFQIE